MRFVIVALALAACGSSGESGRRDPAVAGQAPPPASDPGTGGGDTGAAEASDDEPPPAVVDDETVARVLEGRASYYSDSLAGNRTANGERYDPAALTAASRDLPFGTRVRVVRPDTGAAVIVRVNDRGPFRDHSRILDLSRAAAEQLDMIDAGVVEIRAEVLSPRDAD